LRNAASVHFAFVSPEIETAAMKAFFMTSPFSIPKASLMAIAMHLVFSSLGDAQDIQWARPQLIVGTGDISKHGTYVDALQTYLGNDVDGKKTGTTDITIGDSIFHKASAGADSGGDGIITFSINRGQRYFGSGNNPQSGWNIFPVDPPSSSDYSTIVSNGIYISNGDTDGVVKFSQLKIGHLYEVQVWLFVQDHEHSLTKLSGKNSVTLDNAAGEVPPDGPLPPGAYGNFVLGTFKASGPTEKFEWSLDDKGGQFAAISSIALRDITDSGGKN
jgi:hypothetical protein